MSSSFSSREHRQGTEANRPRTPPRRSQDTEEQPPPIYAVPTTDTLGDESALHSRPFPFLQTPSRSHRSFLQNSTTTTQKHARTRVTVTRSSASLPNHSSSRTASSTEASQRRRRRPKSGSNKNEFQHPNDLMRVTVVPVNVAQRSAFDSLPPSDLTTVATCCR